MMALWIWPGETWSFLARKPLARFWSRRVSAVKFSLGIDGAHACAMSALVLAGLPTTHTCVVSCRVVSCECERSASVSGTRQSMTVDNEEEDR